MTDTPERELIERARRNCIELTEVNLDDPWDILERLPDAHEALLSRVDKLEERVRELSSRVKQLANHGDACDCAECDMLNGSAS